MTPHFPLCTLAALMCVAVAQPAAAQFGVRTHVPAPVQTSAAPHAVVNGVVLDDDGRPLAGAVVSAFGSTSVFAVSDPEGRFCFRNVPYGPYVVRAHLQGYVPPRARLVQVNQASLTVSAIALSRSGDSEEVPVLAAGAGVGAGDVPAETSGEGDSSHDHGEVAWRLRHLKRSVLKDAVNLIDGPSGGDFLGDSLGRAIGTPAKLASIFADVPWNGHLDLLTSTSFDRPQDLLSMQTWPPRGVAFVSLEAPTSNGHWTMKGAVNQGQGDLSSWILAASFQRAPAAHRYEAGLSYGTQSYLGGKVTGTRSTTLDASRNVGAVYAYDDWTITPRLAVNFGGKYARYDYLTEQGLFSPRASVTVTPVAADDTFKVRAAVSHRAVAPGAEEFIPPSSGLWLPPERTFSAVSPRRGFRPERLDHTELAAEREWSGEFVTGIRIFRQRVDDQLITIFGSMLPGASAGGVSHYYVSTAGDFDARGWSVSVSRRMADWLRASVDYTHVDSTWIQGSPDALALSRLAIAVQQHERERFHDVTTTVDSTLPVIDTHVFFMYKVNSRFDAGQTASGGGARFDVQLTQALPFLNFARAELEMLVAVRNMFHEELLDTSVYDEALAIRPPKRIVGGVTVRF